LRVSSRNVSRGKVTCPWAGGTGWSATAGGPQASSASNMTLNRCQDESRIVHPRDWIFNMGRQTSREYFVLGWRVPLMEEGS